MTDALRPSDSLPAGWDAARLAATLRHHMTRLRTEYGLRSVTLFGSYVRNEQSQESDLDVLVDYARTPTLLEMARLQRELSAMLGVRVDLVLRSTLRPEVGEAVLREGVVV